MKKTLADGLKDVNHTFYMAIYNNGMLLWGNVISSLTYASPNEKSRMFHPSDNVSPG